MTSVPDKLSLTAKRTRKRDWGLVVASTLGLAMSPGTLAFYSLGNFIGPINAQYGWNRAEISLVAAILTICIVASVPVVGQLIDRFGVRKVLLPSLFLLGLGLNAFRLVDSLWEFYACFAFIGVAAAGANSVAYVRALCAAFDKHRGLMIGIASSGMGLGLVVIPPVANAIIEFGGWKLAYSAFGFFVWIVGIPVVYVLVHESASRHEMHGGDSLGQGASRAKVAGDVVVQSFGYSAREALRQPRLWKILLLFCLLSGGLNSVALHLVPLLQDRNATLTESIFVASLFGASMMVGRLTTGFLIDKYFAPHVAAVLFGAAALGMVVLALGTEMSLMTIASITIGLCIGADGDVLPYLLSRYFGVRALGQIYGYGLSTYLVGASVFPYLMGVAFERTHSYTMGLWVCSALALASTALLMHLGPFPVFRPGTTPTPSP